METERIIVIGGSGFIGTRLVGYLLESGYCVRIIDKQMSNTYPELCVICDIRDKEKLAPLCKGYDTIYNLAAEHKDNVSPVSLYEEVNVGGAHNTCEAAEKAGIKKIIFTSSVAVYGFSHKEINENHPLAPFNEYGRTKMEAEKIFIAWQKKSMDHSLTIIRPTVVFGECNRGNVYNLLKQVVAQRFIMIGNGKNKKSMAYVGNVVSFLAYVLDFNSGYHLYNYIDKPDMDMNTLVYAIKHTMGLSTKNGFTIPFIIGSIGGKAFDILSLLSGKKFPISSIRIKKFCASTIFSSDRMLSTGFQPPDTIEEGLKKTILYEFLQN
jgi:nucleoside-diphosphate-sugar epimerase